MLQYRLGRSRVPGARRVGRERQDAGRGEEVDALDDRAGADHEAVPEVRRDGGGVEAARHRAAREQGPHLGGEQDDLFAARPRPRTMVQ